MTKIARTAVIIGILLLLLTLVIVRQVNQSKFIRIQEMSQQQRFAQQKSNQLLMDYLREKNKVPVWAKQNGYMIRREK